MILNIIEALVQVIGKLPEEIVEGVLKEEDVTLVASSVVVN